MKRSWEGNINAAVEWLEGLESFEHMRRFRPLGGSCAAETTGHTQLASLKPDHDTLRLATGNITCLCSASSELIVIE